jgi:hypothetical protein
MSEIPFDNNIVITTTTSYNNFVIRSITIKLNEPAIIEVMLNQDKPASAPLFETIIIPVEVYTNWSYSTELIIDYCKTYLQNKYMLPSV